MVVRQNSAKSEQFRVARVTIRNILPYHVQKMRMETPLGVNEEVAGLLRRIKAALASQFVHAWWFVRLNKWFDEPLKKNTPSVESAFSLAFKTHSL